MRIVDQNKTASARVRNRRLSLTPVRPGEGRLTEPTTATRPWRRELAFLPPQATFEAAQTATATRPRVRCEGTRQWHFVDIEVVAPNLDAACFGHLPLPAGVLASEGSPQACVVDKFEQFAGELGDPTTGAPERLLALKFLLHLVGDVHQPLHAADDHDAGGNRKLAAAEGLHPGNPS